MAGTSLGDGDKHDGGFTPAPVACDDMVLALLHLTTFMDHGVDRAWKGFDWEALNRLHERGMISDPRSKAKSVQLTEDGARRSRELFDRHFGGDPAQ